MYNWQDVCRNTRTGISFEKTDRERRVEIENKLCKTCAHYDFYKCKKKNCQTGPDVDNTDGRHDDCYKQK